MRAQDSMELTALHLAVIGGSLECLHLLRQYHAPVDATDRVGRFVSENCQLPHSSRQTVSSGY